MLLVSTTKSPNIRAYGVERVVQISGSFSENFTALTYAENIASVAQDNQVNLVVLSSSANANTAPLLLYFQQDMHPMS